MGFSKVRIAKEKGLIKKYRRMLWQFVGQFYKLPKIILTIAFTLLVFALFQLAEKDSNIIIAYILSIFTFGFFYIFIYPKWYKIRSTPNKKFLIESTLKNIQGGLAVFPSFLIGILNILRMSNYPSFGI